MDLGSQFIIRVQRRQIDSWVPTPQLGVRG